MESKALLADFDSVGRRAQKLSGGQFVVVTIWGRSRLIIGD